MSDHSENANHGVVRPVLLTLGFLTLWFAFSWATADMEPALRLAILVAAGTILLIVGQVRKFALKYWLALVTILIAGGLQAYSVYVVGSGGGEALGRTLAFAWIGASVLFSLIEQLKAADKVIANNATYLAIGNVLLLLALSPAFCPR